MGVEVVFLLLDHSKGHKIIVVNETAGVKRGAILSISFFLSLLSTRQPRENDSAQSRSRSGTPAACAGGDDGAPAAADVLPPAEEEEEGASAGGELDPSLLGSPSRRKQNLAPYKLDKEEPR